MLPVISLHSKKMDSGMNIHILPTAKFKTVLITVFLQQVLDRDFASQTALLPAVLERGTSVYPSIKDLKIRLEELYGAELSADVLKKGERHVLTFSLEVVNDRFAPGEDLLRQGLSVLRSVVSEPLLVNGAFKKEYVEQEKEQLAKEIRSLINDKVSYALERCVQEMCSGERFGVYKYGSVEDLEQITPGSLCEYYGHLHRENPLDIFVVGDVDPEEIFSLIEETFSFPRSERVAQLSPVESTAFPSTVRFYEEKLPVNQGKLTLGFRTNTTYGDRDYPALLFYNGILGGYPHSKLFQNVREKASLAYYAFSRLEKHKGIQLIGSGIEVDNYSRALEIIQEQVELLKKGEITGEEMENTRMALRNGFEVIADGPYSLVNFFLDGLIGGRDEGVDDLVKEINDVKKEDVVEAAHKVQLDTVYFLRSLNGEGSETA